MEDYILTIKELNSRDVKPEKNGRYIAIYQSHGKNYIDTAVYDKAFGWNCNENELIMWGELPHMILDTEECMMKLYESRKEQRHVTEEMNALLLPLARYLDDDTKKVVKRALYLLENIDVKENAYDT